MIAVAPLPDLRDVTRQRTSFANRDQSTSFVRGMGWADVQVVGPPTNPDDGEVISEVAAVPLLEAARRATTDAAWAGELIMLAAECREATRRLGR